MKTICVVTGTRAEYGVLNPILKKISSSCDLELQLVVTGTHLVPEFGQTEEDILNDGFIIDARVPLMLYGADKTSMAHSIGHGIIAFTQVFDMLSPDIIMVLGDRYEIFAAALAAVYSGKVLAHISGGDKTKGGYDEYTRHAITKISHIHFADTEKSAERIIKMGENPQRIFVCGSSSIDTIKSKKLLSKKELFKQLMIPIPLSYFVLVFHPISISPEKTKIQIQNIFEALLHFNQEIIVIYPNSDPGGLEIIEIIQSYSNKYPKRIKAFKNLPHITHLSLMKYADILIGNTSSGITEAPLFHLPFVNIGERQGGRERSMNVIDSDYNVDVIRSNIEYCLSNSKFRDNLNKCKNVYGDGHTSDIICKVLEEIVIDDSILEKSIEY